MTSKYRHAVLAGYCMAAFSLTVGIAFAAANKECLATIDETKAPASCVSCTCGCSPPECDPAAQSGKKVFSTIRICVDEPESTCTPVQEPYPCATRYGYDLPNCEGEECNSVFVLVQSNCR